MVYVKECEKKGPDQRVHLQSIREFDAHLKNQWILLSIDK